MTLERLQGVNMLMVAAREHPLALLKGVVSKSELAKHVQLVLTDRSELTTGREFGVMSPFTWRLGDLFAKHAFLLKGLGWGGMPVHAVKLDLLEGRLAKLSIEDLPEEGLVHGQVGTVVENWAPGVYEVEFADDNGKTYAMVALKAEQLMRLHHEPVHQAA